MFGRVLNIPLVCVTFKLRKNLDENGPLNLEISTTNLKYLMRNDLKVELPPQSSFSARATSKMLPKPKLCLGSGCQWVWEKEKRKTCF